MPIYQAGADISVFANDLVRASQSVSDHVSSYLSSDLSPYVNGGIIAFEAAAIILMRKSGSIAKYAGRLGLTKRF